VTDLTGRVEHHVPRQPGDLAGPQASCLRRLAASRKSIAEFQRRPACRASIASVSSRSFRPLAGTASRLPLARIRAGPRRREHACLWGSSGLSFARTRGPPRISAFWSSAISSFSDPLRCFLVLQISVLLRSPRARDKAPQPNAREDTLRSVFRRAPQCPRLSDPGLVAHRRTNAFNSIEEMRQKVSMLQQHWITGLTTPTIIGNIASFVHRIPKRDLKRRILQNDTCQ
jgi:hypothetical protein